MVFDLLLPLVHDVERPTEEAHRVLVPGGRIACTVWAAPERLAAFGLFFAAVEEHAGAAELPHGPLFGVTDAPTLTSLFARAGFGAVTIETVETVWKMASIEPLLRDFAVWAQLDTFPEEVQRAIESSVCSSAGDYETTEGIAIPNLMLLIAGER